MNLTRVRATIVAGMLASSMVLPGVTAMAATTSSVTKDGTSGAVSGAEIKKTVTVANGVEGIPSADSTLQFSVTQVANASGIVAPNGYQQTSAAGDALSGTVEMSVAEASTSVTEFYEAILSGASINLSDVGEYTFEIKETTDGLNIAGTNSSFGWTSVDSDKTYYLRVVIKNTEDGTETLYFLTDSKGEYTPAKKLQYAAFENTYNKKSTDDGTPSGDANTLTVTKDVIHPEYVSVSNEYEMTIKVQLPETQKKDGTYFVATGDYVATIQDMVAGCDEAAPEGQLDTATGVITYTVLLHDGESVVISNLAEGASYTVEETNRGDFANLEKTLYKVDGDATGTETFTSQTFDDDDSTVVVENTFKDVTATGVVTDIAPYLTLIVVAGAGVAGYMVLKGRMAR